MNFDILERYQKSIDGIIRRNRHRKMQLKTKDNPLLDFSSNDYLGLSKHPSLINAVKTAIDNGVAIGATGSRLLGGHHIEHQLLEDKAARFFGSEKALYFANGFMANYALLTCLPKASDIVVYDALVHASMHDGMMAGKAKMVMALHNDINDFEQKLKSARDGGFKGQFWLVVESVYSMDGDIAPLGELVRLANQYGAFLIVDEAHATGIWGQDGKGFAAEWEGQANIISVHTCGKALGSSGALICAAKQICDYIVNFSRPFIFSTAPSPLAAYTVMSALDIIEQSPELAIKLKQQIEFSHQALKALDLTINSSKQNYATQIMPIVIGDAGQTMVIANRLQENGFDVKGVRPPTVANGSSRLRITITLNVNRQNITELATLLKDEL